MALKKSSIRIFKYSLNIIDFNYTISNTRPRLNQTIFLLCKPLAPIILNNIPFITAACSRAVLQFSFECQRRSHVGTPRLAMNDSMLHRKCYSRVLTLLSAVDRSLGVWRVFVHLKVLCR